MCYKFKTLLSHLVHSCVKKLEKYCFKHATCWLPEKKWEDIYGYNDKEFAYLKDLVESEAHLILEFSQTGGILNASNF